MRDFASEISGFVQDDKFIRETWKQMGRSQVAAQRVALYHTWHAFAETIGWPALQLQAC